MSAAPRFLAPSDAFLRKPTDVGQINGPVVNPPRFCEYGGLSGPNKVKTTVNSSMFDIGNPLHISKPNGGR